MAHTTFGDHMTKLLNKMASKVSFKKCEDDTGKGFRAWQFKPLLNQ